MPRVVWQPTSARAVASRVARYSVAQTVKVRDSRGALWFDPLCDSSYLFRDSQHRRVSQIRRAAVLPNCRVPPRGLSKAGWSWGCVSTVDSHGLPLPAGTLTPSWRCLKSDFRSCGIPPSLVFCWLEVMDFDRFVGFLFLVLHACYFSFADILAITSAAIVLPVPGRPVKRKPRVERFNTFLSRVAEKKRARALNAHPPALPF